MRRSRQTRKTLKGHIRGPRARVAVGCLCHRGDHFGLEPCLLDLPEPGNQLYFFADADRGGLCHPLDRLGNKVNGRQDRHVISWPVLDIHGH